MMHTLEETPYFIRKTHDYFRFYREKVNHYTADIKQSQLENEQTDPMSHVHLANAFFRLANYPAALEQYEIVKDDSSLPSTVLSQILKMLGRIHFQQENYFQSLKFYASSYHCLMTANDIYEFTFEHLLQISLLQDLAAAHHACDNKPRAKVWKRRWKNEMVFYKNCTREDIENIFNESGESAYFPWVEDFDIALKRKEASCSIL